MPVLLEQFLRHSQGCGIFEPQATTAACDCGMLRAEGRYHDLRWAVNELISAIDDGLRRHKAGDPNAIGSEMIRVTLRDAKHAMDKLT